MVTLKHRNLDKRRYHACLVTEITTESKKRRYHASLVTEFTTDTEKRRYHASLVNKTTTDSKKRRYHASLKIELNEKFQHSTSPRRRINRKNP